MAEGLKPLLALQEIIQDMMAHRDEDETSRANQANEMEERRRQIIELIEQLEREIATLPPTPENEAELRRLKDFVEVKKRVLTGSTPEGKHTLSLLTASFFSATERC